jgi:uncharacterized membrane protein
VIVGSYTLDDVVHGYWLAGGVFHSVDFPGATFTTVSGINNAGQMVGSYSVGGHENHGFLLGGGVFSIIDFPGAANTLPEDINNLGQIVGIQDGPAGASGFLLSNGAFTSIDVGTHTILQGINDAGTIVGWRFGLGLTIHGFVDRMGNVITVDVPGFSETFLAGINNTNQIVGEFLAAAAEHGFFVDGSSFTLIDFPGVSRTLPADVNDRGQIVGAYRVPGNGDTTHGFLASPVPEPSSFVPCALGFIAASMLGHMVASRRATSGGGA